MNVPRFGLYFHIPLCLSKCPYCDFLSFPAESLGQRGKQKIVDSLKRELDLALGSCRGLKEREIDTIYFGGGTPSLLEPDLISELIVHARDSFEQDREPREITLECNPRTVEISRLAAFREKSVSRISLGVQSFHDETLRALGRVHSAREASAACQEIGKMGFDSWGLDLIFGTPRLSSKSHGAKSSLDFFREDLRRALRFEPPHVSVYGLTLHEGTEMDEAYKRGEFEIPDEEAQREMFLLAREVLSASGRRHYELSNYALPGHESRHNTLYWTGGEYLGLGLGAHSYLGARRYANPADFQTYLDAFRAGRWPAEAEERPCLRSLRAERVMLALRQCEGVEIAWLSQWLECDFLAEYEEEISKLTGRDLLECSGGLVRLTREGLLLSDSVFEEFF